MKFNLNKRGNRIFYMLLICLLVVTMLFPIFDLFFKNNDIRLNTVAAEDLPPSVSTQAVNDAKKDIAFEFFTNNVINKGNYIKFVKISDISGIMPMCRFKKLSGNRFEILAPIGGYEEGTTYKIELTDAEFVDSEMSSDKPFYFTIKREQVANVELKDNVKQIQEGISVEFLPDSKIKLSGIDGTQYGEGDILIIPVRNDEYSEISLKVGQVVLQTQTDFIFVYELPRQEEVVDSADIYYRKEIDLPDESFSVELEDEVMANIINTDYVQSMNEVVNTVYNARMAAPQWFEAIPQIKVKIETHSPLRVKVEIVWTSANIKAKSKVARHDVTGRWIVAENSKNTPNFIVKIEIQFSNKTDSFVSEKNGVKNVSTVDASTTSLKVSVGAEYKLDVLGEISKKYNQIKYNKKSDNFSNEMQHYIDDAKKQLNDNKKPGDYTGDGYSGKGRPTKQLQERVAKENAAIDAQNSKIRSAREYINQNGLGPEKSNKDIFQIKSPPIALGTPAVTFTFEIGLFFDVEINAEIGVQHIWKTTVETGSIEHNGKTENYHNEIKENTGNIAVSGSFKARVGIRSRAYFTFIGILQIGIKAEVAVYFEASGMYSKAWGDGYVNGVYNPDLGINNPAYDAKPWAAYYDVGWYFNFTAYSKFLIFEPWEFTFYQYKESFLGNSNQGQTDMYDLMIEPEMITNPEFKEITTQDIPVISINENGYANIPNMYKSTYKLKEKELTFSKTPISHEEYTFGFSNYVYFDSGRVYLKDSSIKDFEDIVYAYLVIDGEVDENTFFPFRITKEPVKVEKINAYTDFDGVQIGGRINLNSKCEPSNASYQQSEFSIAYVIKDGVKLQSGLEQFANVTDSVLFAKNTLSIGDKIAVKAHAVADDIWSEPFEVDVIKTPVQEVRIIAEDFKRSIGLGERLEIFPKIYPIEASFPVSDVFISSGNQYGKIVQDSSGRYFLECFGGADIGEAIGVTAVADDGEKYSQEYIFTVGMVEVQKIDVEDEFGNKLLERRNSSNQIQQGASIKLKPVYAPHNATVSQGEFFIVQGANNASIDNDGNLRINKNARIGTVISVIATADGVNSSEYLFEVAKISVQSIELNNRQNKTLVKPGETLQFYPTITPHNATYISPTYIILEGMEYASIDVYGTLTVAPLAKKDATIKLAAIVDGVLSNIYVLTVDPVLAENIEIRANDNIIEEGRGLKLDWTINPETASYSSLIKFEIIEGMEYASINNYGYIKVNYNIGVTNAVIKVRATLDGIYSNILEFNIYLASWGSFSPVENLTLYVSDDVVYSYTNQSLMDANTNDRINLEVSFTSPFASDNSIRYLVLSGNEYIGNVIFENGNYYIYDDFLQASTNVGAAGKSIVLQAEVYGKYGHSVLSLNTKTIRVYIPVESVELERDTLGEASNLGAVQQGMSYNFNVTVFPAYANDSNVVLTANSAFVTFTKSENIISLTVKDNAELNASFSLIASVANGKSSEYALTIEKVWATKISYSFISLKSNSSAALSKVYAGDTLKAVMEYAPLNISNTNRNAVLSFSRDSVVTVNSCASIIGNEIKIKPYSEIRENEPEFTVYAWAIKENGARTEIISKKVNVYIPVMSIRTSLTQVDRGAYNALGVIYNSINGGYANTSSKTFTVKNLVVKNHNGTDITKSAVIDFTSTHIVVPKYLTAGTTIAGRMETPEGAYTNFVFTVKAISLTGENIYYNIDPNNYTSISNDSLRRTMYTTDDAQLEENQYTYVLGEYKYDFVKNYGVSLSCSENSNYASIYNNQLKIAQDAPGNEIVTVTCIFVDGDTLTTVVKKVKVFNSISGGDLITKTVTFLNGNIYASSNDSLASDSSNSYSFVAINYSYYTLSEDGYFQLRNRSANHTTINIKLIFSQYYNGNKMDVAIFDKPLKIDIQTFEEIVFHDSGDEAIITDDKKYDDSSQSFSLNLTDLKTLGYSSLIFTVQVDIKEYDDGYQEVSLLSTQGFIIGENKSIEHGGTVKNGNWATHTFVFSANISRFSFNGNYYTNIYLIYSAHGRLEDNWVRGRAVVKVSAS